MSVNNVDPSTLFGGTWVPWGKGRVPVGVNEVEPEFNEVEKTGGAKSVALTVAQLAPHTHIQNEHNHVQDVHNHWITSRKMTYGPGVQPTWTALGAPDSPNADWWQDIYTDARQPHIYATTPTNQNTGNGETHNNLQSYITCYMWKRTV